MCVCLFITAKLPKWCNICFCQAGEPEFKPSVPSSFYVFYIYNCLSHRKITKKKMMYLMRPSCIAST